jgi:hypothetical protein
MVPDASSRDPARSGFALRGRIGMAAMGCARRWIGYEVEHNPMSLHDKNLIFPA